MKCTDLKEKISGYIDGEISPDEVRLVEGHLGACVDCRSMERRMRALGTGVEIMETSVPADFREKLFERLEKEELLPRRRSLFAFSLRWAAIPLAVAAAFAVFLLISPETVKEVGTPERLPGVAQDAPRVAQGTPEGAPITDSEATKASRPRNQQERELEVVAAGLSSEDREIVAHLDIFEDASAIDEQADDDVIDLFESGTGSKG
jgi:anti-sigma factor RsiW